MIYLNRFLDSEDYNDSRYEQFIITNTNCKELINDLLAIWDELYFHEYIRDVLADTDLELNIDDSTKSLLTHYECYDRDSFGSGYDFVYEILDVNNLLVNDCKELKFEY